MDFLTCEEVMKLPYGGPGLRQLLISEVIPLPIRSEEKSQVFNRGEIVLSVESCELLAMEVELLIPVFLTNVEYSRACLFKVDSEIVLFAP